MMVYYIIVNMHQIHGIKYYKQNNLNLLIMIVKGAIVQYHLYPHPCDSVSMF